MISAPEIAVLLVVALLGHAMALLWLMADRYGWSICEKTIYNLPIPQEQINREIKNSIHTPIHAVMLAGCLYLGCFNATGWGSFAVSLVLTALWAEIWHYWSHRAFHIRQLHWIHLEHHKSRVNSPFTAISFSFTEKLVFNVGILGFLVLVDLVYSLNFFGVGSWYIAYLFINSFSHANFELKSEKFLKWTGRFITTTTYHSLHHSRYTGNYGLGTRFMDQMFRTEWEDYEPLYEQITSERKPLSKLREKAGTPQ